MVISQTIDGELSIKTDDTIQTYNPSVDIEQLKHFYDKKNLSVFNDGTLYYETPAPSLSSLESFLALTKSASEHKPATEGQIGKAIWEAIR